MNEDSAIIPLKTNIISYSPFQYFFYTLPHIKHPPERQYMLKIPLPIIALCALDCSLKAAKIYFFPADYPYNSGLPLLYTYVKIKSRPFVQQCKAIKWLPSLTALSFNHSRSIQGVKIISLFRLDGL